MKRIAPLLLLLAIMPIAQAQVSPEVAKKTANTFLDHLDAGRYTEAEAMFDDSMRKAVPLEQLKAVWASLPAAGTRGEFAERLDGQTRVLHIPMQRTNAGWNTTIAVDAAGRINGLFVKPAEVIAPPPAVPANANYAETELRVGTGEDALPGTLAMPKGKGPFPAVVLVHGSGAHDRNETIHGNRPFLDIARGLAAKGIAVLRYEKRNKAMLQWYQSHPHTIDTETTDDAVTALATLRAQPGIDPKRVFVLGHSQGAMMAPRIGQRDPKAAGLILLAGPARNLLDILVEQNERILKMQGVENSEAGIAHMKRLRAQIAAIRAGEDGKANGTPLNLSADYWRSVDVVDPVAEARKAAKPMLILHGGHDIQVVDADWSAWQRAFGKNARVTMKRYPTLNHLAMTSAPNAGLDSYSIPAHVDAGLINDIAQWIKARR